MGTSAAVALLACLCATADAVPPAPAIDQAAAAERAGEHKKALSLLDAARRTETSRDQREHISLLYAELREYAVAQTLMNDLIRGDPGSARLRLYLATIVARAGDRGGTLAALAEARRRGPDAQDRRRIALLHQDLKDYPPARELLDGLIAEAPRSVGARLDRAALAEQAGERTEALSQLASARRLGPVPAELRRAAALYRLLGDEKEARAAEASLPKAELEDIPDDAPPEATTLHPRLDLARAAIRRGDRAAGLKILSKLRHLKPDLQERQRMALIYEDAQEYATARRMIDALIREQPGDPQLRLDRAYFAADTRDRAAALVFLEETLARSPDPDDCVRIATLYDRLGEIGKARAVREGPGKKTR